jgi:hypothetical protein
MEIPIEVFVATCLHTGAVLYYQDQKMPHPHYYIIINKDPINDNFLVMPMGGSDYQKINDTILLKDGNTNAFVYVEKSKTKIFPKNTGIDCGQLHNLTPEKLTSFYKSGNMKYKGDLESEHLTQIIAAAKNCPRVAESIKALLP